MGCCQNRDEPNKTKEEKELKNYAKHKNKSASVDSNFLSPDLESTVGGSKTSRESPLLKNSDSKTGRSIFELDENVDNSERELLDYLHNCCKNHKWEQLAPFMTNSKTIKESRIYIDWTERPKTIGCVAVLYLMIGTKKYPVEVSPFIEVFLNVLISFLKNKSQDLIENSVILLYYYIDYATPKAIKKLLDSDIFDCLTPWMLCNKDEMRRFTTNLCYKIYKNNLEAQNKFIKADGGFNLIQLIGWYSDSEFLEVLLGNLNELAGNKENVKATKDPLTVMILEAIDVETKSSEVKKLLEKVIKAYKEVNLM